MRGGGGGVKGCQTRGGGTSLERREGATIQVFRRGGGAESSSAALALAVTVTRHREGAVGSVGDQPEAGAEAVGRARGARRLPLIGPAAWPWPHRDGAALC